MEFTILGRDQHDQYYSARDKFFSEFDSWLKHQSARDLSTPLTIPLDSLLTSPVMGVTVQALQSPTVIRPPW